MSSHLQHVPKYGKLEKAARLRIKKGCKLTYDKAGIRINRVGAHDNVPPVRYRVKGRTPLE